MERKKSLSVGEEMRVQAQRADWLLCSGLLWRAVREQLGAPRCISTATESLSLRVSHVYSMHFL
jgi:hypothetical protein